jgi:CubicO group peptidase (beta-lactamase class C family)
MARIGLLMARGGVWKTQRLVAAGYGAAAGTTPTPIRSLPPHDPARWPTAPQRYGLLWWNNSTGVIEGLPRDAFWAWGLGDTLILAVPSLDLVASRAGPSMETKSQRFGATSALDPFFGPIGKAAVGSTLKRRHRSGSGRSLPTALVSG